MLQYIRSLVIDRPSRQTSRQFGSPCFSSADFVEFTYRNLTLSSFRPDQKLTGKFGEYSYSTWDGAGVFPFWRSELNVSLVIPDSRPQQEHLDALRETLEYPISIRDKVQKAVTAYCCSAACDGGGQNAVRSGVIYQPDISPHRRSLGTPMLYLDYFGTRCDQRIADLFFRMQRGEAHRLRVRLQNWRIVDVGN